MGPQQLDRGLKPFQNKRVGLRWRNTSVDMAELSMLLKEGRRTICPGLQWKACISLSLAFSVEMQLGKL